MQEAFESVRDWIVTGPARPFLKAAIILLVAWIISRIVRRRLQKRASLDRHARMILHRIAGWGILGLGFIWALRELGFQLGALLGAAGLFSVAIGFAARASISNLISGLFLLGERPFAVGDTVTIGDKTGEVLSIDLMSVKLRTFDNQLVRVPSEMMLTKDLINRSAFPIRRVDLKVLVGFHESISEVKKVLDKVVEGSRLVLADPKPKLSFQGYAESGMELQYSVWGRAEKFLDVKTAMGQSIKESFEANGIDIPLPQRVIRMIGDAPTDRRGPATTEAPAETSA